MKRISLAALILAPGCGDEPVPLVDTSEPFVEEDLDASCEGIEGTWEATGLDVVAVEGEASRALGGDALLVTFEDDGTFTSSHLTASGLAELGGAWTVEDDGRAQLDPFFTGLPEPVTVSCRLQGDRLSLYGTGPHLFEGETPEEAQILVTLRRVR